MLKLLDCNLWYLHVKNAFLCSPRFSFTHLYNSEASLAFIKLSKVPWHKELIEFLSSQFANHQILWQHQVQNENVSFVRLFLGCTSPRSIPARFFDLFRSEPVLMHSWFRFPLAFMLVVNMAWSPHCPLQHPIHLSLKCISAVDRTTPSHNKHPGVQRRQGQGGGKGEAGQQGPLPVQGAQLWAEECRKGKALAPQGIPGGPGQVRLIHLKKWRAEILLAQW